MELLAKHMLSTEAKSVNSIRSRGEPHHEEEVLYALFDEEIRYLAN